MTRADRAEIRTRLNHIAGKAPGMFTKRELLVVALWCFTVAAALGWLVFVA